MAINKLQSTVAQVPAVTVKRALSVQSSFSFDGIDYLTSDKMSKKKDGSKVKTGTIYAVPRLSSKDATETTLKSLNPELGTASLKSLQAAMMNDCAVSVFGDGLALAEAGLIGITKVVKPEGGKTGAIYFKEIAARAKPTEDDIRRMLASMSNEELQKYLKPAKTA